MGRLMSRGQVRWCSVANARKEGRRDWIVQESVEGATAHDTQQQRRKVRFEAREAATSRGCSSRQDGRDGGRFDDARGEERSV